MEMSMMVPAWMFAVAAFGVAVSMALEWALHRELQRKALAVLRAGQLQQQLDASRKLDSAKRQIVQLQQELAIARAELRQRRDRPAPPPARAVPTREQLIRELDAAPLHSALPADGFPDTLPSEQYAYMDELLSRVRH
jgi:hypothetical protein